MSNEKTEKPTKKKLDDAKKKGQVAVSRDLARLATLIGLSEVIFFLEPYWRGWIHSMTLMGIQQIGKPFLTAKADIIDAASIFLLAGCSLIVVLSSVIAVVAHWGQFGVVISTENIKLNFDRLNPTNGFKQIFSGKKAVELVMSTIKGVSIGVVMYIVVYDQLPYIISLAGAEPEDVYFGFIGLLRMVLHTVIGLCLFLALIDFGIQKYNYHKELRMDMQEIKKEFKEMEGDPLLKGVRKQLAKMWVMNAPVAQTEKANAVVTNPTHFAIALFYDAEETLVPVVLAKGKDEVAHAMIKRAKECGIPVIRHVWLARTLYATCRQNAVVPKSSYEAVAHVYAVVHELYAANDTGQEVELESYGDPPEAYRDE